MASTNGILSPPPNSTSVNSSINLTAKRKRDDSSEGQTSSNGNSDVQVAESTRLSPEESKTLVHQLIDVLKGHDTIPSVLTRSLPDHPRSPQPKRQKAEDSSITSTTILSRLSSSTYTNVDEVLEDIDAAVGDIFDKSGLNVGRNHIGVVPVQQTELAAKIKAFKQRAHELVSSEKANIEQRSRRGAETNGASSDGAHSASALNTTKQTTSSGDKTVLTLYGNAPSARQVFSSLQIPISAPGETRKVLQTIREAGLPAFIHTTKLVAASASLVEDKKRAPTLGDLFATPSTVPPMVAPKVPKTAYTKSLNVGWYKPDTADSPSRGLGYSKQHITSGRWLDYGSAAETAVSNKKKQRDRALSSVGGKNQTVDAEPVISDSAKLDALFKSAYSGFAPTQDDAGALAPTGVMNRIWWQQVGETKFARMLEEFEIVDEQANETEPDETTADFAALQSGLDELDDLIDPSLVAEGQVEKSIQEKDVDEVLEGISELLEILNSHQRVRQMSIGRSGASDSRDSMKIDESELATYEILKSQLTIMIASLPPFAVARLDPDRLSELAISTKIEVQTTNHKGVLQADEQPSRSSIAVGSMSSNPRAIPPQPSLHRHGSSSYNNQYSTAPRPTASASQQYYGSTQTPVRPPSSNLQRPPQSGLPSLYHSSKPPASTGYGATASYATPSYTQNSRPTAPTAYAPRTQQYGQNTQAQSFLNTPRPNYQPNSQQTSQLTGLNRYSSGQPAYAHQQAQSPYSSLNQQYSNGSTILRQASPQMPSSYGNQSVSGSRPTYSTPTPYTQQNHTPQATQATMQRPAQQQSGFNYASSTMTPSDQQSLLEKQRMQLQQPAQAQAMQQARAALASPSPANSNPVAAGFQ